LAVVERVALYQVAWREVFLEECEREACDDNAQWGLGRS